MYDLEYLIGSSKFPHMFRNIVLVSVIFSTLFVDVRRFRDDFAIFLQRNRISYICEHRDREMYPVQYSYMYGKFSADTIPDSTFTCMFGKTGVILYSARYSQCFTILQVARNSTGNSFSIADILILVATLDSIRA